ncbi:MAG: phenylalanine--tRNA ligase subunit beta, partial [Actinomycetes bacterium]
RALAAAGYVETPCPPFVGPAHWDALCIADGDARRRTMRVANALSDEEPELRTTLLPGLLTALRRNVGRGQDDVALFETGTVFLPAPDIAPAAPRLPVDRRPTPGELASVEAALPHQPTYAAVVLAGAREPSGWWGQGREAIWADAVEAVRTVAEAVGAPVEVQRGDLVPWHPGRCARIVVDGQVAGHAGELHPRVVAAAGLPPRTCAAELDLDAVLAAAPEILPAPVVSTYPVAKEDVALVVPADVPAADVERALRDGAGGLLEALRLFDVYTGSPVPPGSRSLAYALRFRAADRTLTDEEVAAARETAVAEAHRRTGAVLRSA